MSITVLAEALLLTVVGGGLLLFVAVAVTAMSSEVDVGPNAARVWVVAGKAERSRRLKISKLGYLCRSTSRSGISRVEMVLRDPP
jgi:hypothetical protein